MSTTAFFHCVFNKDSSITHFMHTGIDELAKNLPNLYVVLLCQQGNGNVKNIEGAIIIRTVLTHHDEAFVGDVYGLCAINKGLSQLVNSDKTSLLPTKVGFAGSPILTEYECLQLATQQYLKHFQTSPM